MDITLKDRIKEDMKEAMRAKDKDGLEVIRSLRTEIAEKERKLFAEAMKERELLLQNTDGQEEKKIELDDIGVINLIDHLIKRRRDSIQLYHQGNRPDLARKEQQEVQFLQKYLPEPLSKDDVISLIDKTIQDINASSIRDMTAVLKVVKDKIRGRYDIAALANLVKEKLS